VAAQTVIIPYAASGYRYLFAQDAPPGAESPGFDDSQFSVGSAGFGSPQSGCSFIQVGTEWTLFTLVARMHLTLGSPVSDAPRGIRRRRLRTPSMRIVLSP